MAGPAVSICIPTFRRLHYLQQAVESALAQTRTDIEVLVGDDGDNAAIPEWCLARANEDARLRYYKNPRRLGLAGNWNALAERAVGSYLIIIGDDDRLLPEFVEALLAAGAQDQQTPSDVSGPAIIFCNQYLIDAEGRHLPEETERATRVYGRATLPAGRVQQPAVCVWRNSVPMSASLVRTRDVQRLRFKPDLNTPEIELFARLVNDDATMAFVPSFLAEYRVHAGSATAAGLTIDRLVMYLVAISAPPEALSAKADLLRSMLPSAVSLRLLAGDREGAAQLLALPEYPRAVLDPTVLLQRAAMRLPRGVACSAYKTIARAKRSLLRLRRA